MASNDREAPPVVEDDFFRQLGGEGLDEAVPPEVDDTRARGVRARQSRRVPLRARAGATAHDRKRLSRQRVVSRLLGPAAITAALVAAAVLVAGGISGREPAPDPTLSRQAPAVGGPARLAVRWSSGQLRDATLTTRWKRGGHAGLMGRLTRADGQPLAGAHLDVLAADGGRADARNRVIGTLRSGRDGRFQAAVALDSGAPDKLITISHTEPPRARARVRLRVRAFIRMAHPPALVRRGKILELAGSSVPRALIQVAVRGRGRWHAEVTAGAAPNGHWRAGLLIPRYAQPGRYRLRARALDPGGLGFLPAETRRSAIKVR